MDKPSKEQVIIGRLMKKLNKMKDQRDKARKDLAHYAKVISMQPYLETRYKNYEERVAERDRIKGLDARVKEQAALILQLQKEIARLESLPRFPHQPIPTVPYWPSVPKYSMGCPVCGIGSDGGAMGYVCTRTDCPTKVSC